MRARQNCLRFVALSLGFFLLGVVAPAAAEPPEPAPKDTASATWRDKGAVLLTHAQDAASSAGQWCADNLSPAAVSALFDEARQRTRGSVDDAFAFAREGVAQGEGMFFNQRAGDGRTRWYSLADSCDPPTHAVILVHGLDDPGTIWDDAAPALADAGHNVLSFHYPNDQSPAKSAALFAEALRDLRSRGTRSIDIVAHSMGGIVSRDVLTREDAYASEASGHDDLPDVRRFIMLAPPNRGSPLAALRGVMEIRDQVERYLAAEKRDLRTLLGFLYDGDGEAGDDLLPGSVYLTELNSRPPPRGVEQTIVVARLLSSAETWSQRFTEACATRCFIGSDRARDLSAALESAFRAVGDGAVPERSTSLDGVDDVVLIASDHRSMVRRLEPIEWMRGRLGMPPGPTPPAIPVILDRLALESHVE